jgi:hypothetical protein
MSEQLENFTVDRSLAAVLLVEAAQVMLKLLAEHIEDKEDRDLLPAGILTCGQALRFVPVLMALLRQAHPDLFDPGQLGIALREAHLLMDSESPRSIN